MTGAVLVALGLVAGDILVRALRLRVLLGAVAPRAVGSAVVVNAYGDAASAVTPARLGGEPARFFALRERKTPAAAALVVLATERVVDMGLAAVVTVIAISFLGARGFGEVAAFLDRFTSPDVLPWMAGIAVLLVAFAGIAVWYRRRIPPTARESLRDALAHARTIAGPRFVAAIGLTGLSMGARVAILPVLLWGVGALTDPLAAAVGSFALIYAQLLLPTPAGAGGVELAFVVGLAPHLATTQVATLLVTWRVLTLVIPAGLGATVFLWRGRLFGGEKREKREKFE